MNIRKLMYSVAAMTLAVSAFALVTPTLAQNSGDTGTTAVTSDVGFGWNFWVVEACSTTDYAAVVADALGITPAELRKAVAGGKSIAGLASEKGVELTAVQDALKTARLADVDAAVTAGLLTADEAQSLKDLLENGTLTFTPGERPGFQNRRGQMGTDSNSDDQSNEPSATEEPGDDTATAPGMRLQIHAPEGMEDLMLGLGSGLMGQFGMGFGGFGMGLGQQVKTYQVAATALNMSCADLVKAVVGGQTIAEVASKTDGGLQKVTDALVQANNSAIDAALSEGLISQVNAESAKANVLNRVLMEISRSGGRGMGFGMMDDAMGGLGGMMGGMMDQLRQHFGGMMGGQGQQGQGRR